MERLSDKYLDYYDPKYFEVGKEAPLNATAEEGDETPISEEELLRLQHEGDKNAERMKGNSNPTDNYGYINKPGIMGAASMIPGPIGAIGKVANTMVNLNNTSAVEQARASMGLEPLSARQVIGSALKDKHGQVADVDINGVPHSTGFEALSPSGATNLTPAEASKRAQAVGGMSEIAPRGKADVLSSSPAEKGGFLGNILSRGTPVQEANRLSPVKSPMETLTGLEEGWAGNLAKNAVESIFGSDELPSEAPTPTARPSNSFDQISPTGSYNPDEPAPAQATGIMGTARDLGNLDGNIDYSGIGANRPHPVNSRTEGFLKSVGTSVLGPGTTVAVNSGDVNPTDAGWTAQGGKFSRSHRHTDEVGADVGFIDPDTGRRVTDPVAIGDLTMNAAAMNPNVGIGWGEKYMGTDTMHLDLSGRGGVWGAKGTGLSDVQKSNIELARTTGARATPYKNAPIPEARPDPVVVKSEQAKSLMAAQIASRIPDRITDQMEKNPQGSKSLLGHSVNSLMSVPVESAKTPEEQETPESKKMLEKQVEKSLGTKSSDKSTGSDSDSKERSKSTTSTKSIDRKDSTR